MLTVDDIRSVFCSVKVFEGSSLLVIVDRVVSVKIMHRALPLNCGLYRIQCEVDSGRVAIHSHI